MLTQIASGFIGDVTDQFVLEKLTGAYSRYGNVIYFTDGQDDRILAIATAKDVIDNEHYVSRKDGVETFYCELIGERNYDEYVAKGNRIIIPGEYELEYLEFTIDEVLDMRDIGKGFEINANASYLEDLTKAAAIEPFRYKGTAEQHLGRALDGVLLHEVGVV